MVRLISLSVGTYPVPLQRVTQLDGQRYFARMFFPQCRRQGQQVRRPREDHRHPMDVRPRDLLRRMPYCPSSRPVPCLRGRQCRGRDARRRMRGDVLGMRTPQGWRKSRAVRIADHRITFSLEYAARAGRRSIRSFRDVHSYTSFVVAAQQVIRIEIEVGAKSPTTCPGGRGGDRVLAFRCGVQFKDPIRTHVV